MNQYPLSKLVHLRKQREQTLQKARFLIEQQLKHIEQDIIQQEKKIIEYHNWRLQEEEKEYANILGKILSPNELSLFKIKFSQLKNQEIILNQKLEELKTKQQTLNQELIEKINTHKQAKKNTFKIETHQKIWEKKEKFFQEKKEEQEAEEYNPIKLSSPY